MPEKIVKLNPQAVERLIENSKDQSEAVVEIYKMAFGPDWDNIATMDGWPKINELTWAVIFNTFKIWHKKQPASYQREIMAGGVWFNKGFSAYGGEHLKNWEVELCAYTLK
jgi:hypothetical protein